MSIVGQTGIQGQTGLRGVTGLTGLTGAPSDVTNISDTMSATLNSMAENSRATQQLIFDQQVATMSILADKLLGAADGIGAASVGLQTAANTPKVVTVAVIVDDSGVTAKVFEEEDEVNR